MIRLSCGIIPFIKIGNEIRFLILEQSRHTRSFPKGGIEDGETIMDCALREFREEVGFDEIKVYEDIIFYSEFPTVVDDIHYDKKVIYFLGKLPADFENKIAMEEGKILDYRVYTLEQLRTLNKATETRRFYAYYELLSKMEKFVAKNYDIFD